MFHVLPAHSLPRAGAGLLAAALYLLCPGVPAPATGHCTGPPRQRSLHRVLLTQAPCHQCNAIWSNDHARPEPSPFTEATEPTVHSAISALLSFSISLPIYSVTNNASFYRSTTSLDRTLPTYCLAEWRPRPPVDGALCSVDGTLGPSYGPSLRGRQDSNFLGTRVPILLCTPANFLWGWGIEWKRMGLH